MRLAVVIVNYNVKYFLEQCLESVFDSERVTANGEVLDLEVWVVDNASVDGSVEMVRERFPDIHLIANTQNVGFAKANNQALRQMTPNASFPDAVLLLNPDTVVERDTLVPNVSSTTDSLLENPSFRAFVESPINKSTPCSPKHAILYKSAIGPIGVKSNL